MVSVPHDDVSLCLQAEHSLVLGAMVPFHVERASVCDKDKVEAKVVARPTPFLVQFIGNHSTVSQARAVELLWVAFLWTI